MTDPFSRSPKSASAAGDSTVVCSVCSAALSVPPELDAVGIAAFAEQESAHCARLHEVIRQRHALAASAQAGIVGMFGGDGIDTTDLVAQRRSFAQLDTNLKTQAEELAKLMRHQPADKL